MPVVYHKDSAEVPVKYLDVDGVLYPCLDEVNQEANIRASRKTEACDDDILVVNFPKSGSNWVTKIIQLLLDKPANERTLASKFTIENHSQTEVMSLPSPRILNSHFRYNGLPEDVLKKRTKLVVVERNPKDIAAALYDHIKNNEEIYQYRGDWDSWLYLFLYGYIDSGCWVEYALDWLKTVEENKGHPIHVVSYESLKENLPIEVEKLASFLQVKVSPEEVSDIVAKCSLPEPETNGAMIPYKKGDVGYWKTKFSVAQSELFDKLFGKRTQHSTLKVRFEL